MNSTKLQSFYTLFFNPNSLPQPLQAQTQPALSLPFPLSAWPLDLLKSHSHISASFPKPIRQYGFIKKYQIFCQAIPYVSSMRPEQMETDIIMEIIKEIYGGFGEFVKMGLWKCKRESSYFQEFCLVSLYQGYHLADSKHKRKYKSFDKFLLNLFFTLNILKACNKFIKNFMNFLSQSCSFGQLFLYICLRNNSILQNNEQFINSQTLKKVIKIFQAQQHTNSLNSNLSLNLSLGQGQGQNISQNLSISKQSIDIDSKLISLNNIFIEPINGCLSLPKLKMYKIMKLCKMIETQAQQQGKKKETQRIQFTWEQFLGKYFEILQQEQGGQICFAHVVAGKIAQCVLEISNKLVGNQGQKKEEFLEETFSYVFQVLQLVFLKKQPEITDQRTRKNILSLREHFKYMKILSDFNITVLNKFCKKILKNNYILQLYKKYSSSENYEQY